MGQKQFKILVADNVAAEGLEVFKKFPNFQVDVKTKHTEQELIDMIAPYDGMIVRSATKATRKVIEAASNLKVIARAGTGYDNIDVEACNEKNIAVLITPLGNSNAVTELTLGLMLDAARNISIANSTMGEGKWEKKKLKGTELKGKTVGIIGLGRIGAGVAKRCSAFDMEVIAYDKFITKERAAEFGAELIEDFESFLKRADYITIHIPLTEQTKNMIDEPQLAIMKPNAVIINVARGGIVNEEALFNALEGEKIGGACVDVYSEEPAKPDKFKFIGMRRCITTPHLGASTAEAQINVAVLAAEHIVEALNAKNFIGAVNLAKIS